jgi:hypothetical protein
MVNPSFIIVVSGLPRSGTSLMMQMLDRGGVETITDNLRAADTDNPRGYYEFERVKQIKQDASWLPAARGKAFKMVSQLLYDLPATEVYRVIFMERDMAEMLTSQEKMLQRLNRPPSPRAQIAAAYALHLKRLHVWLGQQPHFKVLGVSYNDLVARPQEQADRINTFVGGTLVAADMVQAVDPLLHRNKNGPAAACAGQGS